MYKDQKSLIHGALYVVALPIGNPADMNPRAFDILSHSDIIATEDTRVFGELAKNISLQVKRLVSHHNHNEKESALGLIEELRKGKTIALVSDAGTPNISDPGYHILALCYESKIPVIGIPGPSALTLALSICPIGGTTHFFGGFLPAQSNERKKIFNEKSHIADRILFFESPHRIVEHLVDAQDFFKGKIFILREATKNFEETLFNEIPNLIEHFKKNEPRGEFVIIYPGQPTQGLNLEEIKKEIKNLISENLKPTEIWKQISSLTQLTRREIYDLVTELKHKGKSDND